MEKKINIVELLKDCPSGMELDCAVNNDVKFIKICPSSRYPIILRTKNGYEITLTKYGQVHDMSDSKCVIFPKGKTTWEGFQRPFKDGDIVFYNDTISIFKEWGDETLFRTHACAYLCAEILDINVPLFGKGIKREIRYATEKEKQKLFDAIKDNGYKWNPETKKLEKLVTIFKVGDKIKLKDAYAKKFNYFNTREITDIEHSHYILDNEYAMPLSDQYLYDLVPNKFDINTLVPFESRVLVRDTNTEKWKSTFWGFYDIDNAMNYPYECCGNSFAQCIPYEGNEHLLGTTDDCDEFFKIWE